MGKQGRLVFHCVRPTAYGLEPHLAIIQKLARDVEPALMVMDPVTSFLVTEGAQREVRLMLTRLVDFAKSRGITLVLTSLTGGGEDLERTEIHISSIIDTWLLLRDIEQDGERNRGLYVLKSRGMAHSNQIREFRLTAQGIELQPAYVGPGQVLTGSARLAQESRDRAAALARAQERERLQFTLAQRRAALEAQVAALKAQHEAEVQDLRWRLAQEEAVEQGWQDSQEAQSGSGDGRGPARQAAGGRRP